MEKAAAQILAITKIPPERERRIKDNLIIIKKAEEIALSITNQKLKHNRDGLRGDCQDILEQLDKLEDPFNRHTVACSFIRKNIAQVLRMSAENEAREMKIIESIVEQLSDMKTIEKTIEEHQTKVRARFERITGVTIFRPKKK